MHNDPYNDAETERREAEERIRRIREDGQPAPAGGGPAAGGYEEGGMGDVESEALARARARARSLGARLEEEKAPSPARAAVPRRGGIGRASQAFIVIGGVVAVGVVIVAIIALLASVSGDGGIVLPFLSTATPTATATPTETPTPPATETPTPTKVAPNLALPPLTCIFQSGIGCYDYCQDAANAAECQSAKAFVQAQNADPDFWLNCIAPGPGPNVGNPQRCLEDAWRKLNP